jgi:FkbM family methyltransferase
MITLTKHGKTIVFEDAGRDDADPGRIRQYLRQGEFYEEGFLEYVRSLGRRGVYVDVGAYIGTHSIYFALLCEAAHVYAFEPRDVVRGELERNVAANGLGDRITISPMGLASEHKRVVSHIDGSDWSFVCVPLDELVSGPVDVMKIDVEGMELDVLRGATRVLRESGPVIFAEAHTPELRDALEQYLQSFGYVRTGRVFNASPTYELVRIAGDDDLRARLTETFADLGRVYEDRAMMRKRVRRMRDRVEEKELERAALAAEVAVLREEQKQLEQQKSELEAIAARDRAAYDSDRRWLEERRGRIESLLDEAMGLLERSRTSFTFRLGRAARNAWSSAGTGPFAAARRGVRAFRDDELLAKLRKRVRAGRRS